MGTTVTVAFVDAGSERVVFGQVGDSRAYRLRGDDARAGDDRPLARRRARAQRRADAGGGGASPAALGDHPCRGNRDARSTPTCSRYRRRSATSSSSARTALTDMLSKDEIAAAIVDADRDPVAAAEALVAGGERTRRRGQHHRRAVRARRGRHLTRSPRPSVRSHRATESEHVRPATPRTPRPTSRTHGAGPGGRMAALALIARRPRRRRARPVLGHHAVSARSRELAGLIVAALLAGIALASITIARDAEVSASADRPGERSSSRSTSSPTSSCARTVPYADGALLPLDRRAHGLRDRVDLPPRHGGRRHGRPSGSRSASPSCAGRSIALRHDYRVLESYRYLFGVAAVALLLLPSVPGLGERVNGVRLWVSVGPLQFQPGEVAKICLILFLAGYLREKREVLAQGRLKDFGPLVAIWGAAMLVIVQTNDLGSALLNFGIFLAMLYVATGARAVRRGRDSRSSSAAQPSSTTRSTTSRTASRSGCIRGRTSACTARSTGSSSTGRTAPRTSSSKSLYSIANGGFGGTGLGEGTFTSVDGTQLIPYLRTDFIFSAIAQELGLDRGGRAAPRVHGLRRPRDARRPAGAGRLLEAARRGADVRLRAAGVHHRGRRPARRAADRDHAAVRLVRRDERRRELRRCSRSCFSSRTGPTPHDEQADRAAHARRARPRRRARRHDDLLADVGRGEPRGPAGQRDPTRRRVLDRPWAHLLVRAAQAPGAQP